MKKLIIITAILSLILVGCGRGGETTTDADLEAGEQDVNTETQFVDASVESLEFQQEVNDEDINEVLSLINQLGNPNSDKITEHQKQIELYNSIVEKSKRISDCNVLVDEIMRESCVSVLQSK